MKNKKKRQERKQSERESRNGNYIDKQNVYGIFFVQTKLIIGFNKESKNFLLFCGGFSGSKKN